MALSLSDLFVVENRIIKSLIKEDIDNLTIGEELFKVLKSLGDKEILLCTSTSKTWTASELLFDVQQIATTWINIGLKKGEVVAFYCDGKYLGLNVVAFIATLVGGIYTGCDLKFPFQEALNLCIKSQATYLVASESNLGIALKVASQLPQIRQVFLIDPPSNSSMTTVKSLFQQNPENVPVVQLPVKVDPEDIAIISYSSGSTGPPKAVLCPHRSFVADKLLSAPGYEFCSKSSTMFIGIPLYHVIDLHLLFASLFVGAKCVLSTHSESVLPVAVKYKITNVFLVPSDLILSMQISTNLNHVLEDVYVGGSNISSRIINEFKKKFKIKRVRFCYGSTELGFVAVPPIESITEMKNPNCCGIPTVGASIKIVDKNTGQLCGANQIGEILAKGPQNAKCYLNNDQANSDSYDSEGFFKSGDAGYYDDHGFLYITDRYKDIIKCDGSQVSPSELESLLVSHEDIQEAAVIGVPDPEQDEVPKAFVIVKDGHIVTEDQIKEFVSKQVAYYKQLKKVEFLKEFPRTVIGKVDKKALRMNDTKL